MHTIQIMDPHGTPEIPGDPQELTTVPRILPRDPDKEAQVSPKKSIGKFYCFVPYLM